MAKRPTKKKGTKRGSAKPAAGSRGLRARQLGAASPPNRIQRLSESIVREGGVVLTPFRDPLGGNWHLLAGLPLERVEPTPFQRDLSAAHVARLARVVDRLDRFVDPVIVVRTDSGRYWTPNGHHRVAAMRELGARSVLALVIAEEAVAFEILALNTEKAHNVREKSLEVIRMARALAERQPEPENRFALQFEEAAYLTLGLCYESRGRFAGGAYQPVLKRVDRFLSNRLPRALEIRQTQAAKLLAVDELVSAAVVELKDRGFDSPYLKAFVIARINPLRFRRRVSSSLAETLDKMRAAAQRFNPGQIDAKQVARASGPPE